MRQLIPLLLVLVLLTAPVNAVIFHYSDEIDRDNSIAYANRYKYDSINANDFNDFSQYNCFRLDDYNSFANSRKYDSYKPLAAKNIKKSDLARLSRDDYNRIANENKYDHIDPDDVNDYGDTGCWTLRDYNNFADKKQYDEWDRVDFTDFDDLEKINQIGMRRHHFFGEGDFDRFNLHHTNPRRTGFSSRDPYHYNNYKYYKPSYKAYVLPFGATDFRTIEYN